MPKLPRSLYRRANLLTSLELNSYYESKSHGLGDLQFRKNYSYLDNFTSVSENDVAVNNKARTDLPKSNCCSVTDDIDSDNTTDNYLTDNVMREPDFIPYLNNNYTQGSLGAEIGSICSDSLSSQIAEQCTLNPSQELAKWAVEFNISHRALNALLQLLKCSSLTSTSLPLDSRTLLKTPRNVTFRDVYPGRYFHFGLSNATVKLMTKYKFSEMLTIIRICVNIDGLPISKSNGSQLYPILCNLLDNPNIVELVGLYHGLEKPKDANDFMQDFVDEAVCLIKNGLKWNNRTYNFKIVAVICDAPAKSYITYTRGHTGYSSCSKCHVEGQFVNNRVCFTQTEHLRKRTDLEFRTKIDEDHHTGLSLLENLPDFNMVTDIPLDYMHLIYLGVMRKLLLLWTHGKPPSKLPYSKINHLSNMLKCLAKNIPSEFIRKPRSLDELKRWKATEFRQFLLYTGVVTLESTISRDRYLNFVTLHVATSILLNQNKLSKLGHYAHDLNKYFIQTFIILYGEEHVSHNVHNLIHIYKDAVRFGNLHQFSAFPFENFLQKLKPLLRKADNPLSQIVRRLLEENICEGNDNKVSEIIVKKPYAKYEHSNGPLLNNDACIQYEHLLFEKFTLKLTDGDNCCCIEDKTIIILKNIIQISKKIFVVGRQFKSFQDFYTHPCRSSDLGIFKVSELGPLDIWDADSVNFKYVRLPWNDHFVVIPLLHTA